MHLPAKTFVKQLYNHIQVSRQYATFVPNNQTQLLTVSGGMFNCMSESLQDVLLVMAWMLEQAPDISSGRTPRQKAMVVLMKGATLQVSCSQTSNKNRNELSKNRTNSNMFETFRH